MNRINVAAHTAAINTARDLDALAEAITDFVDAMRASDEDRDEQDHLLDHAVAWDMIPTFGGEVPTSTEGVYSWDATRVMYMEGWRPDIQPR